MRDPATKAVRAGTYPGEGAVSAEAVQVGRNIADDMTGFMGSYLRDLELGTVTRLPLTKNDEFNAKLKELTRTIVPMKEAAASK